MKLILPMTKGAPRSSEYVTLRVEASHKRFRPVAFGRKLMQRLQLAVSDPVVIYADGRKLKFKFRPTKKEEVAAAHRLKPDGQSLAITTSNLPEPEYAAGRYTAVTDGDWIVIDLDEPGAAKNAPEPAAAPVRKAGLRVARS